MLDFGEFLYCLYSSKYFCRSVALSPPVFKQLTFLGLGSIDDDDVDNGSNDGGGGGDDAGVVDVVLTIQGKGISACVIVDAVTIGNAQHHLVSAGIIAVAASIPIIKALAIGDAFGAAAGARPLLWGSCLSALSVPSPVPPTLFRAAGADTFSISA